MVPDQAEIARLGRERHALVGLRTVADEVAEAPARVDARLADVVQNRLERGQIAVHVGEHGNANRTLAGAV